MAVVSEYWLKLFSELTELQKRLFAGEKALEIGHGGIVKMSKITCLSRTTITKGIRELRDPDLLNHITGNLMEQNTQKNLQVDTLVGLTTQL